MKCRVYFCSRPGMCEYYAGHIDVIADTVGGAINAAFYKLRATFPDRDRSMWKVRKVEVDNL